MFTNLLLSFVLPCHNSQANRRVLFASDPVCVLSWCHPHLHPFVSHIPQTLFSPSLVNHAIVVLTRADAVLRDNECLADYMEKNARTPLGRLLVDDVDSRVMFVNNFASAYEMR